jgi:hypothetical protein
MTTGKREERDYLTPLTSPPKDRPFAVFDIESKRDDTQEAGFTRPFQLGFYDGQEYISFRNIKALKDLHWYERAISPGGCIDLFMWHLLDNKGRGQSKFAGYDVYAHNMGSFDGLFLPAWLERNNKRVSYKVMPVQSRIQAIEIWLYNPRRYRGDAQAIRKANKRDREEYGYIRILDSFRIMPSALDKIAKAFGLAGKLKEMDLNHHEDEPIWDEYNKIDCEQLYQVIQKYKEMIFTLGGEVSVTAPATAVKLLRRKYIPEDVTIKRNIHLPSCEAREQPNESCLGCAHEFFRSAYYGGRTEVFQRKGTGWYYDVNSSYPFSMTKPAPIGDMFELEENEDFSRFAKDSERYVGFVRCTVEIPEDCYMPPLPLQHGGKLKFPAGRFSGTWDWTELKVLGRIGGKILHVEKSVWMKASPFLTAFVNDLYAMRKKDSPQYKGPALSEIAKILLNSTFGKFGMDQNRVEMVILKPGEPEPWELRYPGESEDHKDERKRALQTETDPALKHRYHVAVPMPGEPEEHFEERKEAEKSGDFETQRWRVPEINGMASNIYAHDSLVRIKDIRVDAAYIIPQIAAHITASSRILLWSFAMDILDRGFHIFYCDTDSLLTDYGDYPDSKELGGLKKEYDEVITIESFAPKMYRLSKPTPFSGEHKRVEGKKQCLKLCSGCLKDEKDKYVKGQHELKPDGTPNCEKRCPGCGCEKIMMKGFPKDYKTSEVLEKLRNKEEISYEQHEKLGVLAKGGFRQTPRYQTIKKSLKSEYDKRYFKDDGDTAPVVIDDVDWLSPRFKEAVENKTYQIPSWLERIIHLHDPPSPSRS